MSPYIYLQVESRSEVLYFRQYRLFFCSQEQSTLYQNNIKVFVYWKRKTKDQHPLLSLGQDTIAFEKLIFSFEFLNIFPIFKTVSKLIILYSL